MADRIHITDQEIWKPIPDYPIYEASSHGRIRSVDRVVTFIRRGRVQSRHSVGVTLKAFKHQKTKTIAYMSLSVSNETGKHFRRVHRLVCMAFHGLPPSPTHQAAHNDGNPLNNRSDNLRWATPLENNHDVGLHGNRPLGEKAYNSKLTADAVRTIRHLIKEGRTITALSHEYGVSRATIHKIRDRKKWAWLP